MNAFYEHHKDSIRFGYRCFDRILLNGLIQPFQQPERVVGFFSTYRHLHPVSRDILRGAAEQFQLWVKEQADKWNAPIVEPPRGRRDEFVDPAVERMEGGKRRAKGFARMLRIAAQRFPEKSNVECACDHRSFEHRVVRIE